MELHRGGDAVPTRHGVSNPPLNTLGHLTMLRTVPVPQVKSNLFLVTIGTTSAVVRLLIHMSYSCSCSHRDWTSVFDLVIVGAAKPGFLTNDYLSLYIVNK